MAHAHDGDEPSSVPLILIVDDDSATRTLLQDALQVDGYAFAEADSGTAAITAYERLRPDIILLDILMPRLDGVTTCARIQALPGGEDVPILMITALSDDKELIDRAFAAGATDFITKPINLIVLRHRVKRLLRTRQVEANLSASEARLANIITTAGDGIMLLSTDLRIQLFNPAAEQIFGRRAEEVLGQPFYQLMPERFRQIHRAYFELGLKPAVPLRQHFEMLIRRKDGAEIPIELSIGKTEEAGQPIYVITFRDISERRKAQEALLASEARYRTVAEFTYDWEFWIGPDGKFIYTSPSCERVCGYPPQAFLDDPDLMYKIVHPDDRPRVVEHFRGPAGCVSALSTDFRIIQRTGEERWISHVCQIVHDDQHTPLGRRGSNRDVTDRRRAEEALRRSKEQYQQLVDTINGIVWQADAQPLQFTFVSEQAERLLGYPVEQWLTQLTFWQDHIHPADREWAVDYCHQLTLAKQNHEFEYRMIAADKRVVWLRDLVSVVVKDGQSVELRGVMVDITAQKQMQEAVAQLSRQTELILNAAGEGIFGLDLQGRHVFVNPAAANMLGYQVEELIGQHSHSVWHYAKPDGSPYPAEECPIYAAYQEGAVRRGAGEIFWRSDGTGFPVEYISTPIEEQGAVKGAVVVFRDITRRKQAEERIRRETARAQALVHSAARLNAQLDLEAVLAAVSEEAGRALGIPTAGVYLYDDQRDVLYPAGFGVAPEHRQLPILPRALYNQAVSEQGPVVVLRGLPSRPNPSGVNLGVQTSAHMMCFASMLHEGQLVGALVVIIFDEEHHVSQDELELLKGLADQSALAIANARLFTEHKLAEARLDYNARQLTALGHLGQTVLASLEPAVVLQQILDQVLPLAGAEGISILLWQQPDELVFAAVSGVAAVRLQDQRVSANVGIVGEVLRTGRTVRVGSAADQTRIYHGFEEVDGYHVQALIAIPLNLKDRTIGVMEAVHSQLNAFDSTDLSVLEAVATWAAIALGNAQQHQALQRRLQESEAMAAISRALNETLDLQQVLELIVTSARYIIPKVERAVIHLLDEDSSWLSPVATSGLEERGQPDWTLRPGEGIAGQVITQGAVINVGDTWSDAQYVQRGLATDLRSLLVAPVQSGSRPLGTISIQSAVAHAFSVDDERLLATLGIQAAIAIENARLYEAEHAQRELAEALRDSAAALTGTLNFDEVLDRILEQVSRVVPYDAGYLLMVEADKAQIVRWHSRPPFDAMPMSEASLLVADNDYLRSMLETHAPVVIADTSADAHGSSLAGTARIKSAVGVPLLVRGEVIGFLSIASATPGFFGQLHANRLQAFADQVAIALENARLYQVEREQYERLQQSQAQLIQHEKMTALGRLAAALAHEINNPLQAIQSHLELVMDFPLEADERSEYLRIARQEMTRLSQLARNVLNFARPISSPRRLASVADLIDQTLALAGKQLQHSHVRVRTDLQETPQVLLASEQMVQVFLNLTLNAVEAMPAGGTLHIATRVEKDHVVVTFANDGPTISPLDLPRIFEPFYTTKSEGTGLGLSISHSLVEQHGGTITAENLPDDTGVIFTVRLPVFQSKSWAEAAA